MFKGKKSKENIKTYKKALRQDLASDSKAPARLRCQSHWLSHLTTVGMPGAHADLTRPPLATRNSHSCLRLHLLSTTLALGILRHLSTDFHCSPPHQILLSVLPHSCRMLMPLCPGSAGGWGRVGSARSGSHGPDQADAGMDACGRLMVSASAGAPHTRRDPVSPSQPQDSSGSVLRRARALKESTHRGGYDAPNPQDVASVLDFQRSEMSSSISRSPRDSPVRGCPPLPLGFGLNGKKEAASVKWQRQLRRAVCILSVRHAPAGENHNGRLSATVPDAAGDGAITPLGLFSEWSMR